MTTIESLGYEAASMELRAAQEGLLPGERECLLEEAQRARDVQLTLLGMVPPYVLANVLGEPPNTSTRPSEFRSSFWTILLCAGVSAGMATGAYWLVRVALHLMGRGM